MRSRAGSRQTIAGGFIVLILLVLVVGQGSLWVWFLFTQKVHNLKMLTEKVRSEAALLADSSVSAISERNLNELKHHVESVSRDEDIVLVRVVDERGAVVTELESGIVRNEAVSINPFYVPWSNRVVQPVVMDGVEIGKVEITFSGARANNAMRGLLIVPPLAQAIVFLIIIRVIYFFFQRNVGVPIGVLQGRLDNVTRGDLKTRMTEVGRGEIADIARGLKFLVERLSSHIAKLNLTADNVVTTIRRLDSTFKNLSEAVRKQSSSIDEMVKSLRGANDSQKRISSDTVELFESLSTNLDLLREVKNTADEASAITNRLFQASDDSYSTVAEMSQTSKVMAQHAQSVLSSVEDTLKLLTSIVGSVAEVERGAKESSRLAEDVNELASERGVLEISEAIEAMEKISENVKYSVGIVRRLDARSKDVEKMLSVIHDVTEQTNLLSFNAAILAQQAGEYGKGFSVVADEMRALSDRTAASTKEIAGIVITIQAEIADAVVSIESGMQMVKQGSSLVYRTANTMGSIVEAARKSSGMTMNIEKSTVEQAKALSRMSQSMDNISRMASRMSVAMEEQFKGSDYMLSRVSEVKEIAETTKKGAEQQAVKTGEISKNLEAANEKIAGINRSASTQLSVNEEMVSAVESIRRTGVSTLMDLRDVSSSLKALQDEIGVLRKDMERFRAR